MGEGFNPPKILFLPLTRISNIRASSHIEILPSPTRGEGIFIDKFLSNLPNLPHLSNIKKRHQENLNAVYLPISTYHTYLTYRTFVYTSIPLYIRTSFCGFSPKRLLTYTEDPALGNLFVVVRVTIVKAHVPRAARIEL